MPEVQIQPHPNPAAASFFRPDIEGLRAIAVLLVIGAHFAIPGLSAGFIGVDIFFVISGYLITSILVREYENTEKIALMRFYANRLRRLLPALVTMLVISSALAFKLLPEAQNLAQSQAAAMAAMWISNIYFSFADANYFSSETGGNAFLHTWSLGVEEQFYLLWPLCILAAVRWIKYKNLTTQNLATVFVVIAVISLGACVLVSGANPVFSFYMMPTRAWQFSAGALVWIYSRKNTPTLSQSVFIGRVGALILLAGLVVIGPHAVYPGALALLPTLGACALLWAGASPKTDRPYFHPATLLSAPPMQAVGRLSYSWYLWHWPILVIGENLLPIKGDAGNTLLAIAISLFAAILTHKLIEEPIRYGRSKSVRHGWQIALALFAMVVLNSQLLRWNTYTQNVLTSSKNNIYVNAIADVPAIYQHGCDDWYHSEEVKPCVYGNENAEKTAVLFGDSIGAQWFPALTEMMDPQQWKIIVLTKSSCPMVDVSFFYQRIGREYTECAVWRDKSIEWLQGRHVDRLFVGGTASSAFTEKEWTEGTRRILDRLARNADAIYLIEANPTLEFNGPDCLMKNKADGQGKCQSRSGSPQYTQVAAVLKNVVNTQPKAHWIETSSFVCPDGQCQAMRNDVVIFRDTQHLTASFTALAAPHFLEQIQSHELPIQ